LLGARPLVFVVHATYPGYVWLVRYEGEHPMETPIRILGDGGLVMEKQTYRTFSVLMTAALTLTMPNSGTYQRLGQLGFGSFGSVHRVVRIKTSDGTRVNDVDLWDEFALKEISMRNNTRRGVAQRELRALVYMRDAIAAAAAAAADADSVAARSNDGGTDVADNDAGDGNACLQMYDFHVVDDKMYLLLNLAHGRELFAWVVESKQRETTWRNVWRVLIALLSAVRRIHALGVAHLDLKPANFVIDADASTINAIVVDFGFAQVLGHDDDADVGATSSTAPADPKDVAFATSRCLGTRGYQAPEWLAFDSNLARTSARVDLLSVDVWALGQTLLDVMQNTQFSTGVAGSAACLRVQKSFSALAQFINLRMMTSCASNRLSVSAMHEEVRRRFSVLDSDTLRLE
jgi:serine/threonine protein kinase